MGAGQSSSRQYTHYELGKLAGMSFRDFAEDEQGGVPVVRTNLVDENFSLGNREITNGVSRGSTQAEIAQKRERRQGANTSHPGIHCRRNRNW